MVKRIKKKIKNLLLKRMHLLQFPKFVDPVYFLNNSKGRKNLIIILIGYKPYLWDSFFERFDSFAPNNADVCLTSTAPLNDKLLKICKNKGFSYFIISSNSVTLAINSCLVKHRHATDIFKIDEDIFLTNGVFDNLKSCYDDAIVKTDIAFVAPLINLNCVCSPIILNELNLLADFENKFGKIRYCLGNVIETNIECAKYLWGASKILQLDNLNKFFMNKEKKYVYATHRFSIGIIYFKKSVLENIDYFITAPNDMGNDEYQLCALSMNFFKAVVVCCNSVVGHFSFGNQAKSMKDFFKSNPNLFALLNKK